MSSTNKKTTRQRIRRLLGAGALVLATSAGVVAATGGTGLAWGPEDASVSVQQDCNGFQVSYHSKYESAVWTPAQAPSGTWTDSVTSASGTASVSYPEDAAAGPFSYPWSASKPSGCEKPPTTTAPAPKFSITSRCTEDNRWFLHNDGDIPGAVSTGGIIAPGKDFEIQAGVNSVTVAAPGQQPLAFTRPEGCVVVTTTAPPDTTEPPTTAPATTAPATTAPATTAPATTAPVVTGPATTAPAVTTPATTAPATAAPTTAAPATTAAATVATEAPAAPAKPAATPAPSVVQGAPSTGASHQSGPGNLPFILLLGAAICILAIWKLGKRDSADANS